jgi:hypothetical protein
MAANWAGLGASPFMEVPGSGMAGSGESSTRARPR